MSIIVETDNLRKQYNPPNGPEAVKGISFAVNRGEIFSLLGPNGAGKSTTLSMLSGLITPTSGDATIDGHSIRKNNKAVKQIIGVVPQEIALYDTLSARDNLNFWGRMYGLHGQPLKERVTAVLDMAGLADRADDKVGTFSGGMKRRINIAVGLLHNPKLLYMDEPTVGIDPQSRRRILDTVKALNEQGLTVLYTTHYMEEAEELSHRIGIVDHGEMIAIGSLAELTATVGQLATVRLDVGPVEEQVEAVTAVLTAVEGVHNVDGHSNGEFVLQVDNANQRMPQIIQQTAVNGLTIRRLELQEPNLEAVFLHLTGRALRD